jgi:hypothetical protein
MVSQYGDMTGIMATMAQLSLDVYLNDFIYTAYQKDLSHIVGLQKKPDAFGVDEYPFIVYLPNDALRGGLGGDVEAISLFLGIYDETIDENITQGVVHLGIFSALIYNALNGSWPNGTVSFVGTLRDGNNWAAHPAYQKELIIPLRVQR